MLDTKPFPRTGVQTTFEKNSTDDLPRYEQKQTNAVPSVITIRTQDKVWKSPTQGKVKSKKAKEKITAEAQRHREDHGGDKGGRSEPLRCLARGMSLVIIFDFVRGKSPNLPSIGLKFTVVNSSAPRSKSHKPSIPLLPFAFLLRRTESQTQAGSLCSCARHDGCADIVF